MQVRKARCAIQAKRDPHRAPSVVRPDVGEERPAKRALGQLRENVDVLQAVLLELGMVALARPHNRVLARRALVRRHLVCAGLASGVGVACSVLAFCRAFSPTWAQSKTSAQGFRIAFSQTPTPASRALSWPLPCIFAHMGAKQDKRAGFSHRVPPNADPCA